MFDITLTLVYFGGMFSLLGVYYVNKWYTTWKQKRAELKTKIINAEKDGWIKTTSISNESHWSNKNSLKKWKKRITTDIEIQEWIEENIKGGFISTYVYGNRYIKFDDDEDGVAFKLRWE